MAEREQIHRQRRVSRDRFADDRTAASGESTAAERKPEAVAGLDELLDEIDELLESNAEEFVKSYVQKGGQ